MRVKDLISADELSIPVPESHKAELETRLKRHESAPGVLLPLDELRSRMTKSS
jgi:hypothetical protein